MSRASSSVFLALFVALGFARCKSAPTPGPGGTIVLSVDSTRPIDRVQVKATDKDGNTTEFSFETKGRDLTKDSASGELVPGTAIKTGPVVFVGFGFTASGNTAVVSGRIEAEFVANARTNVRLSLTADRVDVDEDGYIKQEDCNDNNSKQNTFLSEQCANNIDDDCDGSTDERCGCVTGQTRGCYTSLDQSTRGFGECRDGVQTCLNGSWSECAGSVGPNIQVCNGKDENCDGTIDEGCVCTAGEQRFCFLKQVNVAQNALTNVRGDCRAGVQRCVGTAWGKCEGATYSKAELCDGNDNDCDGLFDNGFDADFDGFTTCGTITGVCGLSGPSGCGSLAGDCGANTNPRVGGTLTGLVDCDDGNKTRHPCQIDRCGDGSIDDNCDSNFEECQTPDGTCASASYAGGYADVGGRLKAECRASSAEFGLICSTTSGLCGDASECQGKLGQSSAPGIVRPECREPLGCLAGQISPPNFTTAAPANDPYNDCGDYNCDNASNRIFAGAVTGTDTGWVINDPDGSLGLSGQYECHVYPTVPASATLCTGTSCETPFDACTREASGNSVRSLVAGAVINQPCHIPLNSPTGLLSNLGSTCITFSNGNAVPPAAGIVAAGRPDPLGRCNAGSVGCSGIIASPWGGDNTCEFLAAAPADPINVCGAGGACDNTIGVAACVAAAGGSGNLTSLTAPPACQIAGACASTGIVPANLAFNANGGPTGGTCPAGSTCYDPDTTGGRPDGTACNACDENYACGANCRACNNSGITASCNRPWFYSAPTGAIGLTGPSGSSGSANTCTCGTTSGNTVSIWCNGTCCTSSQFCTDAQTGSCVNAGGSVSCAGGACNPANQYCNVTQTTPSCASAVPQAEEDEQVGLQGIAPCNQNVCTGNTRCSNFTNSQCADCAAGQFACNTLCCDNTATCNAAGAGSCTGNVYVDGACNGLNCATAFSAPRVCRHLPTNTRRRNSPAATDIQCVTTAVCGATRVCGNGEFCNGSACDECVTSTSCGNTCQPCAGLTACDGTEGTTASCVNCTADATCGPGTQQALAGKKCFPTQASPTTCDHYGFQDCNTNQHCGSGTTFGAVAEACTGLAPATAAVVAPTGTRCNTPGTSCAANSCATCNLDTSCGTGGACPGSTICQTTTQSPVAGTILATCGNYGCAAPTGGLTHLDGGGAPLATCCGRDCIACSATCNSNGTANDYRDDFCNP